MTTLFVLLLTTSIQELGAYLITDMYHEVFHYVMHTCIHHCNQNYLCGPTKLIHVWLIIPKQIIILVADDPCYTCVFT